MSQLAQPNFEGAAGLSVGRRLGAGAFGVVYEAFDQKRNVRVALKTLPRFDAASFYRFKREFRAIADISHRNLVTLFDLVADEERCFFTMELVEGPNLIDHLRGGIASKEAEATEEAPQLNGLTQLREAAVVYGG